MIRSISLLISCHDAARPARGLRRAARRGNVSRAAEALFVTQPALTARLKGLERELGASSSSERARRPADGRRARVSPLRAAHARTPSPRDDSAGRDTSSEAPASSPSARRPPSPPTSCRRSSSASTQLPERAARGAHGPLRGGARARAARARSRSASIRALRHPEVESVPLYEDELVLVATRHHRSPSGRG